MVKQDDPSRCDDTVLSSSGELTLVCPTVMTVHGTPALWRRWAQAVRNEGTRQVTVQAEALGQCDGSGLGLLSYLEDLCKRRGVTFRIEGLATEWQDLLQEIRPQAAEEGSRRGGSLGPVALAGYWACLLGRDLLEQVAFLGRVSATVGALCRRPRRFRVGEWLRMAERVGADATGIICLVGFLFGLIMAFSSAMPLRQFGVEIYVVDLVAFALARVLGPFVTAVLLAGRTASSFAAELGTMKINHELDALEVMNLDPVPFLVVPRLCATVAMAPLLTVATNVMGLIGCALVILSLGYPLTTFWTHVQDILSARDVWIGLVKAMVFGVIVALVGCLRGLQTESGAGAVGISTTRAVVSSIVWLVVAEGIFSVLLFVLDW